MKAFRKIMSKSEKRKTLYLKKETGWSKIIVPEVPKTCIGKSIKLLYTLLYQRFF